MSEPDISKGRTDEHHRNQDRNRNKAQAGHKGVGERRPEGCHITTDVWSERILRRQRVDLRA